MENSKIMIGFMGSDDFSVQILRRLLEDPSFDVVFVVTPPDAPVGRTRELTPCPLKAFLLKQDTPLPLFEDPRSIERFEMDFLVVASYGVILPQTILGLPKQVSLNVHASLLPKYRGASCVQQAILNGDTVSGVTVMQMVARLDAGPIYAFSEIVLRPDHTNASLRHEMAILGGELLAQTIPGIFDGSIEVKTQDESKATYCSKITRESGRIDWSVLLADQVDRRQRAFDPWPGIFTTWNGKRLKLLKGDISTDMDFGPDAGMVGIDSGRVGIQCASGVFWIDSLQIEGKGAMMVDDFIRGYPDFVGAVLGT